MRRLMPTWLFLYFVLTLGLNLGLLSNVVQVRAKQLDAFDIVLLVELLVDGVSAVGRAAHGEQENVLAGSLLKGEGNGDTIEVMVSSGSYIGSFDGAKLTFHPRE